MRSHAIRLLTVALLLTPALAHAQAEVLAERIAQIREARDELKVGYPHLVDSITTAALGLEKDMRRLSKRKKLPSRHQLGAQLKSWGENLAKLVMGDGPEKHRAIRQHLVGNRARIEKEVTKWMEAAERDHKEADKRAYRKIVKDRWRGDMECLFLADAQAAVVKSKEADTGKHAAIDRAFQKAGAAASEEFFPEIAPWTKPDYGFDPARIGPVIWKTAHEHLGADGGASSGGAASSGGGAQTPFAKRWLEMNAESIDKEIQKWVSAGAKQDPPFTDRAAIQESVEQRWTVMGEIYTLAGGLAKHEKKGPLKGVDEEAVTTAFMDAANVVINEALQLQPPWTEPVYAYDKEQAKHTILTAAKKALGK